MCRAGDIAPYVLLPGDPGRVPRIAQLLENAREIANNREFRTITGKYKGIDVSICSTGIGGPSTAIAMQELANLGAKYFIRIGSCGINQEHVAVGDTIISEASVRADHTALDFVPLEFPAVADREVLNALIAASKSLGIKFFSGITMSVDGFYSEKTPQRKEFWRKFGVLAQEMEGSTVLTLAKIKGLKAGVILLAVNKLGVKDLREGVSQYSQEAVKGGDLLKEEKENFIVALDAIKILSQT